MKLSTTLAASATALLTISPAIANAQRLQPCQFNNGKWIQVRVTEIGNGFKLAWDDGPRMTYTTHGSMADRWNVTDRLGGRWHLSDHRNNAGFTLINIDNQNRIKCVDPYR